MILTDLLNIKERELAARKKITLRCCLAAGCMSSGSKLAEEQWEQAVGAAELQGEAEVRGVGCLQLCCDVPVVQGDPGNALYSKVTAENAPAT